MKTYIGTKTVEAQPMTANEAIKEGYKVGEHNGEDGYEVKYKDGYKSWSPKDVFDESYRIAETFTDRLNNEYYDLYDKIKKCSGFITKPNFREIVKDEYPAFLLKLQLDKMEEYLDILDNRIGYNDIPSYGTFYSFSLTFGDAIWALNKGYCINRAGWNNENLIVIKQVPSHIAKDIVPKMQSLPETAKKIILEGKESIDYSNQCLIYDKESGKADSWNPSMDDIFSDDWYIVF